MIETQRKALLSAEATFRRYGHHHQAKGATEKAIENFALADQMAAALVESAADEPLLTEAEVGHLWHQNVTHLPYQASAAEFIAGVRAGAVAVRHKASVVLNQAAQQPVAAQSRFFGEKEWRWESVEQHNLVQASLHEWPGYETRLLYAEPQKPIRPLTRKRMNAVLKSVAESIDHPSIVMTHWPNVVRATEAEHQIGQKP